RNRLETEGLIGFFVNMLVLRGDLSGDPTFQELLGRVREVALGAYLHQDLPFEKLVEEMQPRRDPSYMPLFQVVFALQNAPAQLPELPRLTVRRLEVTDVTAKYDITLMVHEREKELTGEFSYSTDLFEAATVRRMIDDYQLLLERVAADPRQSISRLALGEEAAPSQLGDNGTKLPAPSYLLPA